MSNALTDLQIGAFFDLVDRAKREPKDEDVKDLALAVELLCAEVRELRREREDLHRTMKSERNARIELQGLMHHVRSSPMSRMGPNVNI